jgi:hypothetical protein
VVLIGQDRHVLVAEEDARMLAAELAGLTMGDIALGGRVAGVQGDLPFDRVAAERPTGDDRTARSPGPSPSAPTLGRYRAPGSLPAFLEAL